LIPDHVHEESEEVLLIHSKQRLAVLHLELDLRGAAVKKLYAEGQAWLEGSDQPGELL
jgi:hypothetical protein